MTLVLDIRVNVFVHESFKTEIFITCSSVIFLVLFPIDFCQSQTFWGLIFLVLAHRSLVQINCKHVVSMTGSEFRVFLANILNPPFIFLFKSIILLYVFLSSVVFSVMISISLLN